MVSILGLEHPACEGKKCSYPKADSLVPMDATKLSVTCCMYSLVPRLSLHARTRNAFPYYK